MNLPNLPKPFRVEQPRNSEPFALYTARQMINYAQDYYAANTPKLTTFAEAWERMVKRGYRYSEDNVEKVRMGWDLAMGVLANEDPKPAAPATADDAVSERDLFDKANILDSFNAVPSYRERELMFKAWRTRAALRSGASAQPADWVKQQADARHRAETREPIIMFFPGGTIFDADPGVVLDGYYTVELLKQILTTLES